MRLALFLALLISVFDGFAAPRPLTVKRMGLEQGLSQVTARVIAQDGPGQVWIGTESGLNIHDGAHVRHLRHDPENYATLSKADCYCDLKNIASMRRLFCGSVRD